MKVVFLLAIAVVAVPTSGCGDGKGSTGTGGGGGGSGTGGSGASCAGRDTACGGDIVGTWAITDTCNLTINTAPPGICPETQISGSNLTETGTFTFRADGTASEDVTWAGTIDEVVPASCLGTALPTCDGLDAQFRMPVPPYMPGSCMSIASGACECTASFQAPAAVSAAYMASGSMLTIMNTSGTSIAFNYCAQGSTLVLSVPGTTGGAPTIVVLARQ